METKTVVRDKSLRDIWNATDKSTIDILQDTRKLSQNINSPNKPVPPIKPSYIPPTSKTKKTISYFNSLEKENRTDVQGLFRQDMRQFEEDNVSLHSIWTPTNNDNLKNEPKSSYDSPLIDLEPSENSNPKHTNVYTLSNDSTSIPIERPLIDLETSENPSPSDTNVSSIPEKYCGINENRLIDLKMFGNSSPNHTNVSNIPEKYWGINENPLIDPEVFENSNTNHKNIYASSKDYTSGTNESHVTDQEISKNSNPKHKNVYTLHKDNKYRNISRRDLGMNNDNESEKSPDELNEETFGKFSYAPNESELTLSDISEATAACNLNEDLSTLENSKTPGNKPRVFEFSNTLKDVLEVQEMTTGTKPKTFITKVYQQNNLQQHLSHKDDKRNSNHRNPIRKKEPSKNSFSNLSHMTSNSEEIRKTRPLQSTFKRYSPGEQDRVVTRTRETFHSQITPNEHGVSTRTRETFHTKGNMSYYTAEKITYVRGEKLENTCKRGNEEHQDNIVWRNNICDFKDINSGEMITNYDTKRKNYFQDASVPQRHDRGKRLSNSNLKTSYREHTPDTDHSSKFKNRNGNSKRHGLKYSNQERPLRNETISLAGQDENVRDETNAKYTWQSSSDESKKFNFDKPDISHDKTGFENNYSQKCLNNDGNAEKYNVTHFRVYDPKKHRPSKKKIVVNPGHTRYKDSLLDNSGSEKTEVPHTESGKSMNKDWKEQFDSRIANDQYSEHTKLKNNLFNNSQNEKTEAASGGSMNKNLGAHYDFFENFNLDKANKVNKTVLKDKLSDIKLHNNDGTPKIPELLENSATVMKSDAKKHLKTSIIRDGKEIADLIVGSERALDMFKSFYYEWIDFRKQSISLLEQIVTIIDKSRKNDTMKHVIAAINIAAGVAVLIPHPGAAMGAKVAGAVGGFLNFFKRTDTDCKKDVNAKEYEIKEIFQRDIDSSSSVYIYGVQCGSQFQETCNAISKFHKQLLERNYLSIIENDDVLEFMNEITEYNYSNTVLFYKRLRLCYERLIKSSNSEGSRAFIRVFEDMPNAVSVIDLLPWKFDSDGFDNSIVQNAWDELFLLFQDVDTVTVDIIKNKIQSCLFFLKKEHLILSRNVAYLFKETFK